MAHSLIEQFRVLFLNNKNILFRDTLTPHKTHLTCCEDIKTSVTYATKENIHDLPEFQHYRAVYR